MKSKLLSLLSTIRVVGLLLAGLAMWIFAQLADEVLEKESFAFDTNILLALRSLHTQLLDRIMTAVTFLGEPKVLLVVGLSLAVWLLVIKRRSEATTFAIGAGGAVGLNALLKELFARARPALWERVVDVRFYSFPSGHAMVSMVVYGLIGYLLANRFRKWRTLIVCLTILLVTLIGLSRLYLGVHWPTDIIAGYTAGLVWLTTCIFSLEVWREYRTPVEAAEDKSLRTE